MPILNYTTDIAVEKTISEIEKMLVESGAENIFKNYDEKGNLQAIAFILNTSNRKLTFRLPMNHAGVLQTLKNQSGEFKNYRYGRVRKVPLSMVTQEQASKVGWRIIKDWLEAQLALYFIQMVKVEEIFLPFMYNQKTGMTIFQMLEKIISSCS